MLHVDPHPLGTILRIKAQPGARRNGLVGVHNGALKIAVTQVAERGKANRALIDTLAKALKLRRSQIELLSGETSTEKRLLITGIASDQLLAQIDAVLGLT